jgi:hypothetical protein
LPVSLDDDRGAVLADIGFRRFGLAEMAKGGGRNMVRLAKFFGEDLRTLELPRGPGRSERLEAGGVEIIDDPGGDRRIRADHDKIHGVTAAESNYAGMVGDIERHAFGFPRDAGIARRAPEFRHQRGSRDLPRQSVFATAGTEQKNVHAMQPDRGLGHDEAPGLARHRGAARTAPIGCGYVAAHNGYCSRALRASPKSPILSIR